MFAHAIDDITITSIFDRRRVCANGEYPIRIRVNWKKIRKYYPTGKTCTQEIWDKLPTAKSRELVEMRKEIQNSFSIILAHVKELHEKDTFTIDGLDKSLQRISGETLNSLMQQKINQLENAKQIGTKVCYENTLSNITKFGGEQIPIENVTIEWLKKFQKFMVPSRSIATLGINMRNIRAIMNIAIRDKIIKESQYPFGVGKYEIQTAKGKKKALPSKGMKKIVEVKFDDPTLKWFKDLFLFVYYCNGINVADLINLKYKNMDSEEITFIREKTRRTTKEVVPIKVALTDEIKQIIKKWGNPIEPDNYIFNTIEHTDDAKLHYKRKKWFIKRFNQKMKIIGAAVGIFNITTYTARHTFATILKRKGVNISYISECLGHTSLTTTASYLDSFEIEERKKNAKLLTKL